MKKIVALIVCVLFVIATSSCGTPRIVSGKYCDTYGLFNKDKKCEGVSYRVIVGNVVWGVLLVETIFAPIYFFGFSLYEPINGMPDVEAKK